MIRPDWPLSDQHPTGINPDVMAGVLRSECWLRLSSDGGKPRRNEHHLKARLRNEEATTRQAGGIRNALGLSWGYVMLCGKSRRALVALSDYASRPDCLSYDRRLTNPWRRTGATSQNVEIQVIASLNELWRTGRFVAEHPVAMMEPDEQTLVDWILAAELEYRAQLPSNPPKVDCYCAVWAMKQFVRASQWMVHRELGERGN